MPNNSAFTLICTVDNQSVTAGYYSGGTLTGDADIVADNIKSGTIIFGVTGNLSTGTSYGISKTGQTTSYATNDDGNLVKGTPISGVHYQDNGDGTITDNATGLEWVKDGYANADTNPATNYSTDGSWRTYAWANALLYCFRLNDTTQFPLNGYLGHNDWRLPSYKELTSILNLGNLSSAIGELTVGDSNPGAPFINTKGSLYWSSTTNWGNESKAWYVDFYEGTVYPDPKSYAYYVRCVR